KQQNLILAGFIGGIGALLGDTFIFLFIRHSFIDEIEKIKNEKPFLFVRKTTKKIFHQFNDYLLPIIAAIFIASPLPTEVGIALMATIKKISLKQFFFIAYILHTFGIFVILVIGNTI
ncbi:MAG: hypothetical protein NTV98_04245, partial [Candidatus Roizmanbacteria bacterium]|nr:hypothetical protein [Candidatus Roizmanbacteria bacterium]